MERCHPSNWQRPRSRLTPKASGSARPSPGTRPPCGLRRCLPASRGCRLTLRQGCFKGHRCPSTRFCPTTSDTRFAGGSGTGLSVQNLDQEQEAVSGRSQTPVTDPIRLQAPADQIRLRVAEARGRGQCRPRERRMTLANNQVEPARAVVEVHSPARAGSLSAFPFQARNSWPGRVAHVNPAGLHRRNGLSSQPGHRSQESLDPSVAERAPEEFGRIRCEEPRSRRT